MNTTETKAPSRKQEPQKSKSTLLNGDFLTNGNVVEVQPFFNPHKESGNNPGKKPFFNPVQTKLKVGQPGDKYEQEADSMADKVVQKMNNPESDKSARKEFENSSSSIQRKPAFESDAAPALQKKANINTSILTLQKQESKEEDSVQEKEENNEEETLQRKPVFDSDATDNVQAKTESSKSNASNDLENRLNSTQGGGSAIPEETRTPMESTFDADFSKVRVHTGRESTQMNKELGAHAFTHGNDIYFNEGKYNPGSNSGKQLLAHELTHTIQQGAAPIKAKSERLSNVAQPFIQKKGWLQKKIESGLNWAAERLIPGYTLLNVILGKNLITDEPVERSGVNIIRGYMRLWPVIGSILLSELEETDTLTEAGKWVDVQVAKFGIDFNDIANRLRLMWDEMSIWNGIDGNVAIFKKYIGPVLGKFLAFSSVVNEKVKELRFEGALRLVGATELLEALKKSPQALKKVIDDPKLILKYFMNALKQGFSQFKENFIDHFKNALLGWLFGKAAEMGVEIPKKLDIVGFFHLITQLVGCTYQQIRKQAVKKLGASGEAIVSKMEKTVEFVHELVTEGPAALWRKVQEGISNLKEMFFSAITNLVLGEIIKVAVTKLLSMLNPAGAIIQLVMTLYRVIKFFIDWWDTIREIAQGILSSITHVALGNIELAANFIEKLMAKGMKLVIAFLAAIFGLGGIVDKVKKLIKKIADPIQKAVGKVIDWIVKKGKKLFKKLAAKGKAFGKKIKEKIVSWWKAKEKFKGKDGKNHTLFFKGNEKNAELMIASDPQTFEDFIRSLEVDKSKNDAKNKAINIAKAIDKKKLDRTGASTEEQTKKNKQKKKKDLEGLLAKLSPYAAILLGINEADLPVTKVKNDSLTIGGAVMAKKMTAELLTKKGPDGSSPVSDKHDVFDKLLLRKDGGRSYYVRGHLLNDNMHGPGTWDNMTPLSQEGNKNHLRSAETPVKNAVLSGAIIRYTVTPIYGRSVSVPSDSELKKTGIDESMWEDIKKVRSAEKHVPKGLTLDADMLEKTPDGKFKVKKKFISGRSVINPVDTNLANYDVSKGEAKKRVSITNDSVEEIVKNTTKMIAADIQDIQKFSQQIKNLYRYQQIIDKISESNLSKERKEFLSMKVRRLQEQRNVVLN